MNHMPYGDMYGQVMAYRRARGHQTGREQETARIEAARHLKVKARRVFMTHPAATDQDFERCWPAIRDEMFVRYTLNGFDVRLATGKP
jgi:hypothetical protein